MQQWIKRVNQQMDIWIPKDMPVQHICKYTLPSIYQNLPLGAFVLQMLSTEDIFSKFYNQNMEFPLVIF
jgi:hypothetical protein